MPNRVNRFTYMTTIFKKFRILRRNRKPITSKLDAKLRPLHFVKCRTDRRFAGILIDQSQPKFLTVSELAPADVLFCACDDKELTHGIISYGSSGDYVHVAIYIGGGKVVEAIKSGVVEDTLANVVARYPYVAICRCPGAEPNGLPELSDKVVAFCKEHVKLQTPYNLFGSIISPLLELRELKKQPKWPRRFTEKQKKRRPKGSFFCSEFVIEAFTYGGYITEEAMDSAKYSPTALAEENDFCLFGYLGNPDMAEHIRKHDLFLTGGIS
ncbi:hypothetical protein RD02_15790 [Pectobacterium brasiliense]|nr:hypothetical protein RC83_05945 [Pectobacterium brasiliense]KHT39679.1 hypothetical protein RD02_15790 [Pectobacterium brasiliense]POE23005.1 hypothetical protein BV923_07085 [Pectobacterium odoriferum]